MDCSLLLEGSQSQCTPAVCVHGCLCAVANAGNREETQTELARLQGRLANVSAGDAAAAATKVAWSDPGGRMLGLMLRWREERKAALQAEILRQEQRLANFAALDSLLPGQQMPAEDPLEKLVEWLTTNGAQVHMRG